jgi:phage gpG-like protein
MMDLLQLIARVGALGGAMEEAVAHSIEHACVTLEKSAKDAIGTYRFGWVPLAESTLARKAADTPLYETGELQDSYEHNSDRHEGYVGSDNPKAEWHEYGTQNIPARPVLGGALIECEPEIMGNIAHGIKAVMGD